MCEKIDYSKLTNKEITQLARKLAKTNTLIWNDIMQVEELVHDPLIMEYWSDEPECKKFLKRLAISFKKIKKNDDSFVDIETSGGRVFQDMDYFTGKLQEMLETIED